MKTNNQFANSFNAIRTNLRVAFQPIYDFILPAINALMRGLATLTTYIANFTSALFGKTYKQSYDAAKGIETAKKAMDGYGSSAKKTKGQLASFDEINTVNTDKEGSAGGANDFEMEMPDLTEIDEGPIEKLKKTLAELFKPFKDAWNTEGQNTINSIKRAFQNIKEVVESVGKSFKEVWTGGSGKDVLESLLRLLQLILNIVGDVAAEFKKAWENNDNGTRLIQSVFNALQNVLLLIESIGNSWREVWNNGTGQKMIEYILGILTQIFDLVGNIAESFRIAWETNDTGTKILQGIADTLNIILGIFESIGESLNKVWGEVGQDIANTFMKILESSISILKKVAEGFKEIWDRGGQHLFESLIKLGAKIFEIAGFIYTEFVAPFVMWFVEKISPAIGVVLDWIAKLVDGLIWLLDEFLNLLKGIKEGKLGEFFVALWDGIKKKTEDTWNAIKTFLVDKIWNPIKNIAKTIWEGIKKHILDPIQQSWTNLKQIWDNIKSYILTKWTEIKNGISNIKNNLVEAIKSPFIIAKDWIDGLIKDAFNWGKNLIGNIVDGITSMVGKVKDAVGNVIGAIANKLQFNSPAKEGPGKYADRWMPNLMNMLAEGIEDNVYKVSAAVDITANTLSGVQKADNTSSIINAISGALGNSNSSGDTTIIVKIGEDTITEKVVSNINRQNRISGKTVITV
ncbi:hypothetical protein [Tissierella sp. P1]|uniref:phage tail protein n=1 Tax=Tissierella sp. P1 TaxID=1280483 RepID=UPI001180AB84|nr:hypothetical protein [Tissierella sp. P1]